MNIVKLETGYAMMKDMKRRGLMFVLSSPSGAGKTTLSRLLLEREDNINLSISVTTRPKRSGEVNGRDYHFIDRKEFEGMVANNQLLEHAKVFENYYGTPMRFVHEALGTGTDVLFDIDWQGTRQLARTSREDLVSIFILPPSLKELERRLRTRAQDSEEIVARRMSKAAAEISHWQEYDYVVINSDLEETLGNIKTILCAERMKRVRQPGLPKFVNSLVAGS